MTFFIQMFASNNHLKHYLIAEVWPALVDAMLPSASVGWGLVVGDFFLLTEGGLLVGVAGVTTREGGVGGWGIGVRVISSCEGILCTLAVATHGKEGNCTLKTDSMISKTREWTSWFLSLYISSKFKCLLWVSWVLTKQGLQPEFGILTNNHRILASWLTKLFKLRKQSS